MSELTTSKINRQFRSLRGKCAALTSLTVAPPRPKVAVTYGSHSRNVAHEQDDTPPLAILQSLDKLGARLHFDRSIVENMQLSKRIYEVRDAFKNIVQSTFGPPHSAAGTPSRILTLAGICARVVGEHVEVEMNTSLQVSDAEDEVRGQIMDALYEEVPSQYRSYTLVAHALTYILDTCPHHPTLLHALLEVCIAHGLVAEAQIVLQALFTTSILPRPNSTYICPLTHPAHKNFLVTLKETCGPSNAETSPIINDRTFTRILINALSHPCPEQLHAWTSRAVIRLAREFAQQDFAGCFVPLVAGLATALGQGQKPKRSGAKGTRAPMDVRSKAYEDASERLAKWLVMMLDTVHRLATTADGVVQYSACLDFLVQVEPFRLHTLSAPPASPGACVVDALCCLTACCLASPLAASHAESDLCVLSRLLRDATVRNQTLDDLVSRIIPLPSFTIFRMPLAEPNEHTPTPPPVDRVLGDGVMTDIDTLAAPLAARGILRCEAALYRGALEHVEILISSPLHTLPPSMQLGEKALHELRLQLLDRAEDAERRCYGNTTDPSRPPDVNQEWVWEEMVGSWVVKSPAPAQAKIAKDRDLEQAAKRRRLSRSHSQANILLRQSNSMSAVRNGRTQPVSSSTGRLLSSWDKENSSDGEDYQDIGTDPLVSGETVEDTPVPTRVRKFATTLRTNAPCRTVLFGTPRATKDSVKPKPKPRASAPARVVHFAVPESPASAFVPASAPPRRQSNFATLLADSHKNAISLRDEKARERARASLEKQKTTSHGDGALKRKRSTQRHHPSKEIPSSDDDFASTVRGDDSVIEPESSPVRGAALVEPSSDDALNLFAYPDSSPVKSRRRVF
ncbi:hypothetical protein L227DRAFT_650734 [Lentinus tigrinus ALCF2SS1-6]|uniref:Uncharacterized protein n=1 Tax=Lentinus tigrinus ALCF2SS1-6 TaxID=1328759 RepID=A0A5C2SIR7_9APHY|nr:hypothetical protein L227DRAFT_650734 [Lentinus tigrinus ALCF2SS1-6]